MHKIYKWVWCRDGYQERMFDFEAEALDTKRIYGGEVFPVYRKYEDATTKV